MIKRLYRPEFEIALQEAPAGSVVIDAAGEVFRYTGGKCGFALGGFDLGTIKLRDAAFNVLSDVVSYPVMLIELGSEGMIDKEPEIVLNYLTKVWEEASEPEDGYIPAGSVVIHRAGNSHDYRVWEMLGDLTEHSFMNLRIVSSPPPKVGFYMQGNGYAFYWDGSAWSARKVGIHCNRQEYGFSNYIGDVKEDTNALPRR